MIIKKKQTWEFTLDPTEWMNLGFIRTIINETSLENAYPTKITLMIPDRVLGVKVEVDRGIDS